MGAVIISWIVDKPVAIRPLVVSKINTAAQIGLAAAVLSAKAFGWRLDGWLTPSLYIVAALTIASTDPCTSPLMITGNWMTFALSASASNMPSRLTGAWTVRLRVACS